MKKVVTNGEQETFLLAGKFAECFKGGEIIALEGDLGAGKTVFAKGLASVLGVKEVVTSPTFVIMKVYEAKLKSIKKFVHIDAYRLQDAKDLEAIGVLDYFVRKDTVVAIEWPEKVVDALPKIIKTIKFKQIDNKREITI